MKKTVAQSPKLNIKSEPFWKKYAGLLLAAFSFLLYANTIGNGYNMDDELVTIHHKLTAKGIKAIPEIFTSPYYSDEMGYSYEYRPTVLASFAIEKSLIGESAGKSHFVNVLLYALLIYLLYALLQKLFESYSFWLAFLTTLLFASHPIHTEVVASIKNRDEILALMGSIGAWLILLNFIRNNTFWLLFPALGVFTLGFLSKTSIAPVAILIPLSFVFFTQSSNLKLILISILLLLPVFIFSPLGIAITQLPYYAIIALIPSILNLIISGKINFIEKFKKLNSESDSYKEKTASLDQKFTITKPSLNMKELVSLSYIASWLIVLSGLIASVYLNQPYLKFLFLGLFSVSFYFQTSSQKQLSLLLFSIAFTAICLKFGLDVEIKIGLVFVLFYLFFVNGFQNWLVVLASFILFMTSWVVLFEPLLFIVPFIALLARLKNIKKIYLKIYYFLIFIVVVFGSITFIDSFNQNAPFYNFLLVPILLLLISTYTIERVRPYFSIWILILIPMLFLYSDFNQTSLVQHKLVYQKGPQAVAPKWLPIQILPHTDRPLRFIEMPVSNESPIAEKLGLAADIMGFYLKKTVLPYPLGFYYGFAYFKPVSIAEFWPIFYTILYIMLGIAALLFFKKNKILSFAILFYLANIVLFSGLFYPVAGVAGERFAFTASLGFCLLLGSIFATIFTKENQLIKLNFQSPYTIVFLVLLFGYSATTFARNKDWKDPVVLMRNDMDYLENSAQANNIYATKLMKYSFEKEYASQSIQMQQEALVAFKKSIEIYPEFLNVWFDLGRVYLQLNDLDNAYNSFEQANKLDSTFSESALNMAQISMARKDTTKAIKLYEQIVRLDKTSQQGFNELSFLYFVTRQPKKSIATNEEAIKYMPNWTDPYNNIARVYLSLGDSIKAKEYLRKIGR